MLEVQKSQKSGRQDDLKSWIEIEIGNGNFAPGTRIDEKNICNIFGVSRTPVREALLQLASLGLVEFRPRQGAVVKTMTARQIAAMWEVLTSLESLAASLAARRMERSEMDALEEFHRQGEAFVSANDIRRYDLNNSNFHKVIYSGCKNDYLKECITDIRRRLHPYRRYPFERLGGLERSHQGHARVLGALRAGDSAEAASMMHEHVSGAVNFLDLIADLPPINND